MSASVDGLLDALAGRIRFPAHREGRRLGVGAGAADCEMKTDYYTTKLANSMQRIIAL